MVPACRGDAKVKFGRYFEQLEEFYGFFGPLHFHGKVPQHKLTHAKFSLITPGQRPKQKNIVGEVVPACPGPAKAQFGPHFEQLEVFYEFFGPLRFRRKVPQHKPAHTKFSCLTLLRKPNKQI